MNSTRELLLCGGAAGHLQHIYENLSLTFAEVKDIIQSAAEGRLERVTEKLDGINLVFTYDASTNELKVARNGSEIKRGGMDATELAKKFYGRGNIEEAFNIAFKILNEALTSLPDQVKVDIFGESGDKWFSMEIIYAKSPNTINYDGSSIVFHEWPVFEVNDEGSIEQSENSEGVDILSSQIEIMQSSISNQDWKVRGPSLVTLKKMADGSIANKCISTINSAMQSAGVSDSDTMHDYLRSLMRNEVSYLSLTPEAEDAVVERAVKAPGAPGVPQIKKIIPKEQQKEVADFIKSSDSITKEFMRPIEAAINDFIVELLRGISSTLINKNDQEIQRLKSKVERAISVIEASGNELAMDVLQKEMQRLRSVENITAAMEGIVFFHKGNAYKLTGPFSSFHQILSLFTFGRKGIPPMDLGESTLRKRSQNIRQDFTPVLSQKSKFNQLFEQENKNDRILSQLVIGRKNNFKSAIGNSPYRVSNKRMLVEGGHMYNTQPISLETFNEIWSDLETFVYNLGVTDVDMIGSTGKKSMMGDIDLAVEFDGSREDLFSNAKEKLGEDSVSKVGSNIVTILYPVGDEFVQVDLMIGKLNYLKWSRFGTSNIESHEHFSPLKGVARNILFAIINRYVSSIAFADDQKSDVDRTRYNVDFDNGLFKVVQTRRNKNPNKPPIKAWKTVEKELISDDPDKIAQIMFGEGTTSGDLLRVEDVIEALESSPILSEYVDEILSTFSKEIREIVNKNPKILGDDSETSLEYIDSLFTK